METILSQLQQKSAIGDSEYLAKMKAAGLPAPPPNYPIITKDAIRKYLLGILASDWSRITSPMSKRSIHAYQPSGLLTFKDDSGFCVQSRFDESIYDKIEVKWDEVPVEEFEGFPPTHVLDSMIKAKNDFEEFRIVTVQCQIRPCDPLLVGIKKGRTDRFLIDWWDTDIDPSQIEIK